MNAAQERFDLELDAWVDAWLASRNRGEEPASAGRAEMSESEQSDIDQLVAVLGVVAADGFAAVEVGERPAAGELDIHLSRSEYASSPVVHGSRAAWLARTAAVLILVLALCAGLLVALGGRRVRGLQPGHATVLPEGLIRQLTDAADFGGDPYPSHPIQFVETSAAKLGPAGAKLFGYTTKTPGKIWIGQLLGDFYGQPSSRSGLYHVVLAFAPARSASQSADEIAGADTTYPLSRWGTVYDYTIKRPAPQPPLSAMPERLAANLNQALEADGDPYPSTAALWVPTSVAEFERLTHVGASVLPTLSGASPNDQLVIAEQEVTSKRAGPSIYISTLLRGDAFAFVNEPLLAPWTSVKQLERLGGVRQDWLGQGLPTTVPASVAASVGAELGFVYAHPASAPKHVAVRFVGVTDIALQQDIRPQLDPSLTDLPGNTPVWVAEVLVPHGQLNEPGNSVWLTVSDRSGASASGVGTSFGGSNLWGIASVGQLGPVHTVAYTAGSGVSYDVSPSQ
ncbi:MAG: hypothetical protein ACRD0Z_12895 [Acidimicrobiales bacterium]